MKQYVYLSLTPEALIASHLSPVEFGNYLATGARKRLRGQALFLETDPDQIDHFPQEYMEKRLVPYKDGEPKRSLFLSIYRVLEQVPLKAMKNLFLVTDDGKVLELSPGTYNAPKEDQSFLYQQFNPSTTRVASKLTPPEFIQFLTDTSKPVSVPRIFLAELKLNKLARDPEAPIHDLPYPNPDHLRECLIRLTSSKERQTKTVIRQFRGDLPYRTIQNGFFVGDQKGFLHYPFPSVQTLESRHYSWWRSALTHCF